MLPDNEKLKTASEYNAISINIIPKNMLFMYFSTPENAFETIPQY